MKKHLLLYSLSIICLLDNAVAQIEVPLEINDGGYLFIKVKINDTDEARFMFDTGAGVNIISGEIFNKFRSTLKAAGLHTGTRHNGEKSTGMMYILPSISVGGFKKPDIVVGEWDGLSGCDGIISMNYFENTPVTIDFVNKKLVIENETSLAKITANAENIPIQLFRNGKDELSFFVTLCLDDKSQATAEFDTGSGFNILMLQPRYMQLLNIEKPDTKQDYGYYIYSTFMSKLSYCNTSLSQSKVFVGFKEGLIYDGLIGSGMFRNKKLTIDIAKQHMLVRGR